MKHGSMVAVAILLAGACAAAAEAPAAAKAAPGSFAYDVEFMRAQKQNAMVLTKEDGFVLVAPAFQGRVMTSAVGLEGMSLGWINYPVVKEGLLSAEARKGKLQDHIYVFGGEERFWMGPEGGQYAIFFPPAAKFDFDSWHTPPVIDTERFDVVKLTSDTVEFKKDFELINYSGTKLKGAIQRTIRVLGRTEAEGAFGVTLGAGVKAVAYETDNRITNKGEEPWTREKGLLSIWLLGMYKPSPATTVVIPFKAGPESELGPKVNDAYFGKIPPEYLQVKDDLLFLKGDGTRRGKIGISPARSLGIAGSYAADTKVLTLVTYNVPAKHEGYVNSMWEMQKEPYGGDAINSYNDGSPEPGKAPLGPFYELETSSPAAALKPNESIQHLQRTIHVVGAEADLDAVAKAKLGVGLAEIAGAFTK